MRGAGAVDPSLVLGRGGCSRGECESQYQFKFVKNTVGIRVSYG